MRSKRILGQSVHPSYFVILFFLALACMVLSGCSKNCADYEKELNAYADGSKPVKEVYPVLKECQEALAKCPKLAVAYEVMGDIDARSDDMEKADKNYDKALALKEDNERVNAKKEKISGALSQIQSDAAASKFDSIKDMPLVQYARLDEAMRISWCEKAIENPTKYVFVHLSMSATFVPKFSGTPQQLDSLLVGLAEKDPGKQTRNAAEILFTMSSKGQ